MKTAGFPQHPMDGPAGESPARQHNLGFANTGQHGAYLDDTQGVVGSSPARRSDTGNVTDPRLGADEVQ
jgi:hypothetical protein